MSLSFFQLKQRHIDSRNSTHNLHPHQLRNQLFKDRNHSQQSREHLFIVDREVEKFQDLYYEVEKSSSRQKIATNQDGYAIKIQNYNSPIFVLKHQNQNQDSLIKDFGTLDIEVSEEVESEREETRDSGNFEELEQLSSQDISIIYDGVISKKI